ncbi:MAG: Gfo/Idh/MocA family oxidoreductase [Clostridia bacterium]|nr:Gfo/Idh/MocA family oxidoreductase [Clostridia bacterium]
MENKKLKVALIGCGMIAASHMDAIINDKRAEVVALVCGRDYEKGKKFKEKYNIPFLTNEYNEVLEKCSVDMAIVCNPSSYHGEVTIAFLNKQIPVLCEKPLDVKIDTMTAMIDAANKNNVLLGCVFPNRTQSGIVNAKKVLDSGELGKMRIVEFQYRGYRSHSYYANSYWRGDKEINGGGCLINQGSHGIDALIYLCGNVKKVCAVTDIMGRKMTGEDTANALMEFDNGAHGMLMGTVLSYFPEKNSECDRIRIECERGTIVFADGKTMLYKSLSDDEFNVEEIQLSDKVESFGESPEDMDMNAHFEVVSNFIDGVLYGKELIAPASDARRGIDLILTIYESAKTNEWKEVPHFDI